MKLQRDRKALLHFNIAMDLNRDSKDYHTIKTHIERLHIRGVKETDEGSRRNPGRMLSTSSSSTAGDDRDRVETRGVAAERVSLSDSIGGTGGAVSGTGAAGTATMAASSPQQPHASGAGSQRPAAFMSQHYG